MTLWKCTKLLWFKNWRIKQRESRLNEKFKKFQVPPLTGDILIPLLILLLLIRQMCVYNVQISSQLSIVQEKMDMSTIGMLKNNQNQALLRLERSVSINTPKSDATGSFTHFFMMLPLLLNKTNQTLAFTTRNASKEFLSHLNQTYPSSIDLGIPPYQSVSTFIQVDKFDSMKSIYTEDDHGKKAFAFIDIDRQSNQTVLLRMIMPGQTSSDDLRSLNDQMDQFYTRQIPTTLDEERRVVSWVFPDILPFQLELNSAARTSNNSTIDWTPETQMKSCQILDHALQSTQLRWSDLGHSIKNLRTCQRLVPTGSLRDFFVRLLQLNGNQAQVNFENVSAFHKRPSLTRSGPLEGNILLYMAYLFLWPLTRMIRDMILEKEKQLKEYLLIMGVPSMAILASWALLYIWICSIICIMACLLLTGVMYTSTLTGNFYFGMLLMMFCISVLTLGMAMTPIFNRAKTAVAIAPFVYLFLCSIEWLKSIIEDTITSHPTSSWLHVLNLLEHLLSVMEVSSAPVSFLNTMKQILQLDNTTGQVLPVTWDKVDTCLLHLVQLTFLYAMIGWYLEQVFPRPFGVRRPWYFLFQVSFWCPRGLSSKASSHFRKDQELEPLKRAGRQRMNQSTEDANEDDVADSDDDDETLRETPIQPAIVGEADESISPFVVQVRHLCKTYEDGKTAVQNVSFDVCKGEIFGLLGTNGAGKSTTMSVLCGMLTPTQGDAFVSQSSVSLHPNQVRQKLSVCFQQNLLFDELTLWEHLELIHQLKQALRPNDHHDQEHVFTSSWQEQLDQFQLTSKKDARAKTLSGGQKRKLSLLLALLDPHASLVLLDEPTAGMDLQARVDTWKSLRTFIASQDKAIILTTHSMQEAEALCQHIGIMTDGILKCLGSSLFLKETYGVGYRLTIVHDAMQEHEDKVKQIVLRFFPQAQVLSQTQQETRMRLPKGQEKQMIGLLRTLEENKNKHNIVKHVSVKATDLEDVFVQVTQGEQVYYGEGQVFDNQEDESEEEEEEKESKQQLSMDPTAFSVSRKKRFCVFHRRFLIQLWALFIKRWKMLIRDRKSLFYQFIWPLVMFIIYLYVIQNIQVNSSSNSTSNTSNSGLDLRYLNQRILLTESSSPLGKKQLVLTDLPSVGSWCFLVVSPPLQKRQSPKWTHFQDLLTERLTKGNNIQVLTVEPQEWTHQGLKQRNESFVGGIQVSSLWSSSNDDDDDDDEDVQVVKWFYNASIETSLPFTIQMVQSTFCQLQSESESSFCDFKVMKKTLEYTKKEDQEDKEEEKKEKKDVFFFSSSSSSSTSKKQIPPDSMQQGIFICFAILMTVSSINKYYIVGIVKEREAALMSSSSSSSNDNSFATSLKRFQMLQNVDVLTYWFSHFLFDMWTFCMALSGMFVIFIVLIDLSSLVTSATSFQVLMAMVCTCFLYGITGLLFSYVWSLFFSSSSSSLTVLSYVELFQMLLLWAHFVLQMIPDFCIQLKEWEWLFNMFPYYALGNNLLNLLTLDWVPAQRQQACSIGNLVSNFNNNDKWTQRKEKNNDSFSPWDQEITGKGFEMMMFSGVLYLFLLVLLDQIQMHPLGWKGVWQAWKRTFSTSATTSQGKKDQGVGQQDQEHEDENEEDIALNRMENSSQPKVLRVSHLTKTFVPKKTFCGSSSSNSSSPSQQQRTTTETDNHQHQQEDNLNSNGGAGGDGIVHALNDVSFSVEQGESMALLGVNGSGKSTCFEILSGSLAPSFGKAFVSDMDITSHALQVGKLVVYCPQTNWFFNELTVKEHLTLVCRLRLVQGLDWCFTCINNTRCNSSRGGQSVDKEKKIVQNLLESLQLIPVQDTWGSKLSGGNKRRLLMAISLLASSKNVGKNELLLLMDEPSAGVDVVARRLLWKALQSSSSSSSSVNNNKKKKKKRKKKKRTCLFTTHSMEEAEAVCTNAVVLSKGKCVWHGSLTTLKQRMSSNVCIQIRLKHFDPMSSSSRIIRERLKEEFQGTSFDGIPVSKMMDAWRIYHQSQRHSASNQTSTTGSSSRRVVSPSSSSASASGSDIDEEQVFVMDYGHEWIEKRMLREQRPNEMNIQVDTLIQEIWYKEQAAHVYFHLLRQSQQTKQAIQCLQDPLDDKQNNILLFDCQLQDNSTTTTTKNLLTLADCFELMENLLVHQPQLHIVHYAISELSLENVFQQFTTAVTSAVGATSETS